MDENLAAIKALLGGQSCAEVHRPYLSISCLRLSGAGEKFRKFSDKTQSTMRMEESEDETLVKTRVAQSASTQRIDRSFNDGLILVNEKIDPAIRFHAHANKVC